MGYFIATWILISIIAGTVAVQDFLYRLPTSSAQYSRVPTSTDSNTFIDDAEAGLHSADFNLAENIEAEDERGGLDPEQRREVVRLMKVRGIGFDEARREWMEKRFRKEGIGKDGLPRDPKLVTFS
ncbi:hypothetical protein DV736_g5817, partial [Chaetothyriales sp. CBS 134916]